MTRPDRIFTARRGNDLLVLGGIALLKLLLHLPFLHRFGYHHDELYFIACGEHLAFGYVDHAPMVPWIARLATSVFGESLHGLRLLPTLAGAATIFLTGLLARRLGGGRFAQVAAALAVLTAPVWLRTGNLLCIPAFEPLFWVGCYYLLVRIVQEDNPRLWPWVGLVAGLGLMNKHSMLFFGFALVIGLIATPLRKHFRSPWLYAAGAIALLVFLPNLVWQVHNGWPTFYFLLGLNEDVMSGISILQFLAGQLLYLNPGNAVIWIGGLLYFLRAAVAKPYRILGWMWLAVFVLLLVTRSKIYYLAPAYPALLAGGGLALERFTVERGKMWLRPVVVGASLLFGAVMVPASVPMLSIDATDRYMKAVTFGAFDDIYELTGDLHGMFGWKERVEAVAGVYNALSPGERGRSVIFATGYGTAGAIDYFGDAHGLPNAVSLSMTYYLWGLPETPFDTVISAGYSLETLRNVFDEVEEATRIELQNVNPGSREFVVAICRRPKEPLAQIWKNNRPW